MRAERRLGELITLQKETVGLAQGKRTDLVPSENQVSKPTLESGGRNAVPIENHVSTSSNAVPVKINRPALASAGLQVVIHLALPLWKRQRKPVLPRNRF